MKIFDTDGAGNGGGYGFTIPCEHEEIGDAYGAEALDGLAGFRAHLVCEEEIGDVFPIDGKRYETKATGIITTDFDALRGEPCLAADKDVTPFHGAFQASSGNFFKAGHLGNISRKGSGNGDGDGVFRVAFEGGGEAICSSFIGPSRVETYLLDGEFALSESAGFVEYDRIDKASHFEVAGAFDE